MISFIKKSEAVNYLNKKNNDAFELFVPIVSSCSLLINELVK